VVAGVRRGRRGAGGGSECGERWGRWRACGGRRCRGRSGSRAVKRRSTGRRRASKGTAATQQRRATSAKSMNPPGGVDRAATPPCRGRREAAFPRGMHRSLAHVAAVSGMGNRNTGIIQLYPLPFIYTVRSDLREHLPTCGSAAIVRIQYPNMEKRVRLAGFTRIAARKKVNS